MYEVEFVVDAKEYDYDIDALPAKWWPGRRRGELSALEGEITITEALDIALDKAGLTRDQVQVTTKKKQAEQDNNRRIYDGVLPRLRGIRGEIDAATGTILTGIGTKRKNRFSPAERRW